MMNIFCTVFNAVLELIFIPSFHLFTDVNAKVYLMNDEVFMKFI